MTVGNDGWLATMKRRSDEDTEVKEKEERAFKQQLQERIDPDLGEEKKEQMLRLLLQYQDVFEAPEGIPTTTPLITHAIQSGDKVHSLCETIQVGSSSVTEGRRGHKGTTTEAGSDPGKPQVTSMHYWQ